MSTMTRTDTHSPKNFDPAEYSYVGTFDQWRDYPILGMQADDEDRLVSLLSQSGFEGGNFSEKSTCDHCGARMRYVEVWVHIPTGQHIATGETCSAERFDLDGRAAFDRKVLIGRAKAARENAKKAASIAATHEAHPDLAAIFEAGSHDIIRDIGAKLEQWGSISDRQIALVRKIHGDQARRLIEREAEDERKVAAPAGRVTFEGKVVSRKFKDSEYGGAWKLTVKCDTPDGLFLVWVTEPAAIEAERNDIVRMTATLKASDSDPSFAFGKRPSKAEILPKVDESAPASSLD